MLRHIFLCFCLVATARSQLRAFPGVELPVPIEGAVSIFDGTNFVYLLGGSGGGAPYYDTIYRYQLDIMETTPAGTCPLPIMNGVGGRFTGTAIENFYLGGLTWNGGEDPYGDHTIWKTDATFGGAENLTATAENHEAFATLVTFAADDWYVIGGMYDDAHASAQISQFTPSTGAIVPVAQLPVPVVGPSAAAVGADIYIFGGDTQVLDGGERYSNSIVKFTPLTSAVEVLATVTLPFGIAHSSAVAVDATDIYVIGGFALNGEHSVTKFTPGATPVVEHIDVINLPTNFAFNSPIYNPTTRRIFTFGGSIDGTETIDDVWYIDIPEPTSSEVQSS